MQHSVGALLLVLLGKGGPLHLHSVAAARQATHECSLLLASADRWQHH